MSSAIKVFIVADGFQITWLLRPPLLASAIGAQAVLSDADVSLVRSTRRDDIAGKPLAWRVAMQELVRQLTP